MTQELARRIAFTIGALLIFRLGSQIPLPGVSSLVGPLSGSALHRVSIFSLTLVPYLSAAVIIRFLCMVWGRLNSLERSGEAGRGVIARYTLILTLLLATFQAYYVATALQNVPGLVDPSDNLFLLSATTSMVGGVFLLIWLCEQITRYGIGNGLALVLSVNILASLPTDIALVFKVAMQGSVSSDRILFHVVFWVAVVTLMVFIEGARRNIRIEFAERKIGSRLLPARSSMLPIKLNSAGLLIPIMAAPWFWWWPLAFAAQNFGKREPWLIAAHDQIAFGKPASLIIGSIVVFVLAFIYTSYVLDPEYTAEQLGKQGGVIPGVAPGEPTADHLDRVVTLTTLVGALYLTALALIREALVASGHMLPYKIGGRLVLVVVCTILDIQKQVRDLSLTDKRGGRR